MVIFGDHTTNDRLISNLAACLHSLGNSGLDPLTNSDPKGVVIGGLIIP